MTSAAPMSASPRTERRRWDWVPMGRSPCVWLGENAMTAATEAIAWCLGETRKLLCLWAIMAAAGRALAA